MSNSPYQSPSFDNTPQTGYPGQKPASATVFGILNLVFGILGICGSVVGAAAIAFAQLAPPNADQPQFNFFDNPVYAGIAYVQMGAGLLLTILLIAAGAGLLKFKPWGRSLSNYYSILAIGLGIIGLMVHIIFVVLPTLQLDPGAPVEQRSVMIVTSVSGFIGSLVGFVYPSLMLYFMNRTSFKEAINQQ